MYPIKNRTHYANDKECHITAFSKPEQLVQLAEEKGAKVLGICDYGSLSAVITFIDSCNKADIKPVVCCEMELAGHTAVFIAMNTAGWYNLIKLNSEFVEKGSISLAVLSAYKDDITIVVNKDFDNDSTSVEVLKSIMPDSSFVERDVNESGRVEYNLPPLTMSDSRYVYSKDRDDYRISLCCRHNTKFKNMKIDGDYCLEDNIDKVDPYEDSWTKIIDSIEEYKVLNKPKLPKFCEGSEIELLKEMCRAGWKKYIIGRVDPSEYEKYAKRIKTEIQVFEEANLAGYFLIVQDFVNFAKDMGILIGPARGSAGGCLMSYLLGITSIDPMPFNLMFSRFYNSGRNTGDHIEYPDIDIDVPKGHRKTIIDYLRNKHGHDRVAQVITFSTLSGRGALKEVLRAHNVMDPKSIDKITKILPQPDTINDKMEEGKYTSIIDFVLDNDPDLVSEYCTRKNGKYYGELGQYFAQAARIEGTIKSTGKHAAGVVIGHTKLSDVYPMAKSKDSDELIAAIEMIGLAKAGGVKLDILGIAGLDKLMLVNRFLMEGNISGVI